MGSHRSTHSCQTANQRRPRRQLRLPQSSGAAETAVSGPEGMLRSKHKNADTTVTRLKATSSFRRLSKSRPHSASVVSTCSLSILSLLSISSTCTQQLQAAVLTMGRPACKCILLLAILLVWASGLLEQNVVGQLLHRQTG